ncbi:hypothetical protein [Hyphomicrobium sp.]|uniref:hypothetical protein n=1 Tax=Hyphomicrobium sp. TaxID=82 RepID=UPI002FE2D834
MPARTSLVFVGLLAGAMSLPSTFAAANSRGAVGALTTHADAASHKASTLSATKARKTAALKKKTLRHPHQAAAATAAGAKTAGALKAGPEQPKKTWHADDRDRGLDIASEYAPKAIARVRKKTSITTGDSIHTGAGKRGWRHYVDMYAAR